MNRITFSLLVILILSNSGCDNSNEPLSTGSLRGTVKEAMGLPVSGAKIFIIYDYGQLPGLIPKDKSISNPLELNSVILDSFNVVQTENSIKLSWITLSEVNNTGFEVERKIGSGNWYKIGFIPGKGNSSDTSHYSFIDQGIMITTYTYRLKIIEFDGTFEYSDELLITIFPPISLLEQNYPNPFDKLTTIDFVLRKPAYVTIDVYDCLGKSVLFPFVYTQLNGGAHSAMLGINDLLPSNGYNIKMRVEEADTVYTFEKDIFKTYSNYDTSIVSSTPNAVSEDGKFEILYQNIPFGYEYILTGIEGPTQIGTFQIRNRLKLIVFKQGYKIAQQDLNINPNEAKEIVIILEKE